MSKCGDYELKKRQEKPGLIGLRVETEMIIFLTMIMMTMVIMKDMTQNG